VRPLDCYQNESRRGEVEPKTIHTADIDAFATLPQRCWQFGTSVATLLWRKTPEFTLKKKQKIIKNPRHTKCL